MINKYQTKLFLFFIIIIIFLAYSCAGPLRGKEKDLIIMKLEKNHGINPSEVLQLAKSYYRENTQYEEVLTEMVSVIGERSSITYRELPLSSPCLQLFKTNGLGESVILVVTKNELILFNINDKDFEYPIYQISINNINSIDLVVVPRGAFTSRVSYAQLQIILDEKNAIYLSAVLDKGTNEIVNYIKNTGVKEFNSCGKVKYY